MKWLNFLYFLLAPDTGGDGGSSGDDGSSGDEGGQGDPGDQSGDSSQSSDPGDGTPKELAKFASQLSPDIREKYEKELSTDYKDKHLNDVWGELMEAKGKLSRSIVVPDPENPDQEELKAFMDKMGIPSSPDGYELKADGVGKEIVDGFKAEALKMGLTKSQAQKVLDKVVAFSKNGIEKRAEALKNAEQTFPARLTKELGDEKSAEAAVNLGKKFLIRLGNKDVIQAIADSGLLYNTKFMTKIADFEKALGDQKFVDGKGSGGSGAGGGQKPKGQLGTYSSEWKDQFGG